MQLTLPKPIRIGPPILYKYSSDCNNDEIKSDSEDIVIDLSEKDKNKATFIVKYISLKLTYFDIFQVVQFFL
jgi:hypothetical protein